MAPKVQEDIRKITEKDVREAARADRADKGVNPNDPEAIPSYLAQLKSVANQMILRLVQGNSGYSKKIEALDGEVVKLRDKLDNKSSQDQLAYEERFSTHIHSPLWLWVGLFMIFVADLVVNAFVFGLFIDTQWEAAGLAAILAGVILLVAKATAWSVRSGRNAVERWMAVPLIAFMLFMLWLLAEVRAEAIDVGEGLNLLPLYYALNVLFFVAGFLLSFYFRTSLQHAKAQLQETTQARERVWESFSAEAAEIVQVYYALASVYLQEACNAWATPVAWRAPHLSMPRSLAELHEPDGGPMNIMNIVLIDEYGRPYEPPTTIPESA